MKNKNRTLNREDEPGDNGEEQEDRIDSKGLALRRQKTSKEANASKSTPDEADDTSHQTDDEIRDGLSSAYVVRVVRDESANNGTDRKREDTVSNKRDSLEEAHRTSQKNRVDDNHDGSKPG